MSEYVLEREQIVHRGVEEVFAFFANAENLNAITPPWMHFRIVTPRPIDMGVGTCIDYEIRWGLIPMRWTTLIEEWEPPYRFADRQLKGPYRLWHHEHRFAPVPEGTRMTDLVRYGLPLGPLGRLVHGLSVRRDLARIFDHRRVQIEALLGKGDGIAQTSHD